VLEDRDLKEFHGAILTGVTVGIGSLILLFENGIHILVQCSFECNKRNIIQQGHGENINTCNCLFSILNYRVHDVTFSDDFILTLQFENGEILRIIPERNGLESYVVTTKYGICPILLTY